MDNAKLIVLNQKEESICIKRVLIEWNVVPMMTSGSGFKFGTGPMISDKVMPPVVVAADTGRIRKHVAGVAKNNLYT